MKQAKNNGKNSEGLWLLDMATMALTWLGDIPVPVPTVRERFLFVSLYIKSRGNGPRFIDCIKRLAKAVAFCLKPRQVVWSGKPIVTTGRSIEEEWTNYIIDLNNPKNIKKMKDMIRISLLGIGIAGLMAVSCWLPSNTTQLPASLSPEEISWVEFCKYNGYDPHTEDEEIIDEFLDTWRGSSI